MTDTMITTLPLGEQPFYELPDAREALGTSSVKLWHLDSDTPRLVVKFKGRHDALEVDVDPVAYPPPQGWDTSVAPARVQLHARELEPGLLVLVLVAEGKYDVWVRGVWFVHDAAEGHHAWRLVDAESELVQGAVDAFAVMMAMRDPGVAA